MYRTPNLHILLSIIIFALASPVFGMAPETEVTRCWSYSPAGVFPAAVATSGKEIYVGSAGAKAAAVITAAATMILTRTADRRWSQLHRQAAEARAVHRRLRHRRLTMIYLFSSLIGN
jgi:hypothetical protein